jgi:hypothetical protein
MAFLRLFNIPSDNANQLGLSRNLFPELLGYTRTEIDITFFNKKVGAMFAW